MEVLMFCPSCNTSLRPPLSSGRQVCTTCGWFNAPPPVRDIGIDFINNVLSSSLQIIEHFDEVGRKIVALTPGGVVLIGYGGALLMLVGTFCPLVSGKYGIGCTFANVGNALVFTALAIVSGYFVYERYYRNLWGTGLVALAQLIFGFVKTLALLDTARVMVKNYRLGSDSLSRQILEAIKYRVPQQQQSEALESYKKLYLDALQSMHLDWGWLLLLGGVLAVLATAAFGDD
jgi:hypothetical protein